MAVINSGSIAKALYPGFNQFYGKSYNAHELRFKKYTEILNTKNAWEEHVGVTSFGLAGVIDEGDGISYDEMEQAFISRFDMTTYGLGFIITQNAYDDGIGEKIGLRKTKALSNSVVETQEVINANILNRAFNSSYTMGANSDGKELCATDHPNQSGGTWRNELSVAAVLSEAALEQACIDIAALTNDRGQLAFLKPKRLIIPSALRFDASRLFHSTLTPSSAENPINAIKYDQAIPEGYVINEYLDDSTAWFIQTDCSDGLVYYERTAPKFDTDMEFDTDNARFKVKFRGCPGWIDPRCVFGSPGE